MSLLALLSCVLWPRFQFQKPDSPSPRLPCVCFGGGSPTFLLFLKRFLCGGAARLRRFGSESVQCVRVYVRFVHACLSTRVCQLCVFLRSALENRCDVRESLRMRVGAPGVHHIHPIMRAPAVVHVHMTVRACKCKTTESAGPAHLLKPGFGGEKGRNARPG